MASVSYKLLKFYCKNALLFYFKKWQVTGTENIPSGPVIFVPNHQNAFLDAVIVTCSSVKNPWFMTRADVFNKPVAAKMLAILQMLPVYRLRDGFATLKNNDKVFEYCVKKLNGGETIIVFAEGNHGDKYHLRKLQQGFAKIILATDSAADVKIIPVGIQYDSHSKFRSRVLINFGKAISPARESGDEQHIQKLYKSITNEVESKLQKLMLHINLEDYDSRLENLKLNKIIYTDLLKQLHSDQKILSQFPSSDITQNNKINTGILNKVMQFYFSVNTFPARSFIRKIFLKKIKDPQFVGSVKFSVGMVLIPLSSVIQALLLSLITGSFVVGFCYLASIPLSIRLS